MPFFKSIEKSIFVLKAHACSDVRNHSAVVRNSRAYKRDIKKIHKISSLADETKPQRNWQAPLHAMTGLRFINRTVAAIAWNDYETRHGA